MKNMNLGKVLTFVTKKDEFGNSDYVITPIPAYRTPEMEFTRLGLMGKIESYEMTAVMPMTVAVKLAMQKIKDLGGNEVRFMKW
ncbi:MAG: hypothetical protein IKK34_12755 [Clostridia bacterium]|nr:hypothetical protein [Clostridia bacterium]